jgi:hypothetical protein
VSTVTPACQSVVVHHRTNAWRVPVPAPPGRVVGPTYPHAFTHSRGCRRVSRAGAWRHPPLEPLAAVNPDLPPDSRPDSTPPSRLNTTTQPASHTDADVARLKAWHELHEHIEDLHARLQYLKLMLKLGVGGR